jgi:hypothetical protein
MAITPSLKASGAKSGTFDSDLSTSMINDETNAELTLKLRVWLEQINPVNAQLPLFLPYVGGLQLKADTTHDSDYDTNKKEWKIRQWSPKDWAAFTGEYVGDGQGFWDGRFWLQTPDTFADLDSPKGKPHARPNVWCRFELRLATSPADAHVSISVLQLAAGEKEGHNFRSTAALYTKYDLKADFSRDGTGRWHRQRTFIHELGHALGLGHIGKLTNAAACVAAAADPKKDGFNSSECYNGNNFNEADNIMGRGMQLTAIDALPWRKRIAEHTGTAENDWKAFRYRIYPRRLAHIPGALAR